MEPLTSRSARRALGRYELLAELARGGMAVVYVARQIEPRLIERPVVVKRLLRGGAATKDLARELLDEARTLTQVRHPNVVPILDVVEDGDEAFLVLEHVDGVSLAALAAAARDAGDVVPLEIAGRILSDVLAGLDAAHEATSVRGAPLSIVHRDVSPQNILVGADGVSRLIDFGIAKANEREVATTGEVLKGKLGYFAPEQLHGLELDRRVDVFAAGIVLHELLAGRRLFQASDHARAMMRVLLDEIPAIASLRDDAPAALDEVLARALDRDRDARFATAAELLEAVSRVLPPASPVEVARYVDRLLGARLEERRSELRALMSAPTPRPRGARRAPRAVLAAAVALVAIAAAGAAIVGRDASPSATAVDRSAATAAPIDSAPSMATATPPATAVPSALATAPTASPSSAPAASIARAASPAPAAPSGVAPSSRLARPAPEASPSASTTSSVLHDNPYRAASPSGR